MSTIQVKVFGSARILAGHGPRAESQTLPLALANRAFVWMKLLQFDKAEVDLLWILQTGKYPRESLYKIYQRLGIVLQNLRKTRFDVTLGFFKVRV